MSDHVPGGTSPSLYGSESGGSPAPAAKPQGVLDQFIGLFTEPTVVFQRLRQAPSWLPALLVFMGVALLASLIWAAKVDQVAMTERRFEVMEQAFKMQMPAEAVDKALDQVQTAKPPYVSAVLGTLLGMPFGYLLFAAILFAFAKFGGEDETTTFRHALAATTVHGLVALPIPLLAGVMALLKDVGGAASYASLAPTTLNFWLQPENPWVRGALAVLDPFYLFSFVTLYLAARHTLRLKQGALIGLMILMGFFGFVGHFMGGLFS